jgi:NAD(P)-dependent dehydrogenase (short-subunit alcohol dehydrogenase family)
MVMEDSANLKARFGLVTGGSRGIGKAIATCLASAGCNIVITSRNLHDCQAVAKEIRNSFGVQALAIECDVSKQDSVHDLFHNLRKWSHDRLDILVCNAGYPFLPEIWNTALDAIPREKLETWYAQVFRTDTMGSIFCTYEALPLMKEQNRGSIIYISSTPALEGYQGAPYTVAKAALLGLMKDIAREYGRFNIRANALALGSIRTPATFNNLDAATQKAFAEEASLGRWGKPLEVGLAALFLASDLSSFVTGHTLVVDGGTVRL